MRVGFVVEQLLAPVPGGTGRFARQIAAALAATAAPGDAVDGWCAWRSDTSAAAIAGLGGPHRVSLGHRALAEAWSRGVGPAPTGADVVHAPTLLMPPRRRAPVVVTIHDAVPWTHPETLTARGVSWHRRMGERAATGADLVTVDTRAVADALGAHLDLGDRVRVLGAGASLVLPPDAAERRQRLGLPAGYLAFVGTLEPRKGLDVLLDALPALDLPLAVVGPQGWGGVDLPVEAGRRGLSERVLGLGLRSDDDLAAVVAGARAVAVPSLAEGFGLPLLEAMALGTPVVASDDPALVEVGEGASVHVPVGDSQALALALAEVAGDPDLRARLRAAGLEVARRRTWAAEAERLWGFYRGLVG